MCLAQETSTNFTTQQHLLRVRLIIYLFHWHHSLTPTVAVYRFATLELGSSDIIVIMSEGNRPYVKNNSFSKKPGLAQIASYTVFLLETILFYSVVLPRLRTPTQVSFGICYSASLVMLVVSAVVTSLADPADLMMVCYRNSTLVEYF